MGSDVLGARLDLRLDWRLAAATGSALGSRLAARLDRRLADRGTEVVLPDRPLLLMAKCWTPTLPRASSSFAVSSGSAPAVGSFDFEAFRLEGGLDVGLGGDSTTTT